MTNAIGVGEAKSEQRACSLESGNDGLELFPNCLRKLLEARMVDRSHRCHGIETAADLVLCLQRLIGERRVARTEDLVAPEINAELLVQCFLGR
jgi:hypothetical protein